MNSKTVTSTHSPECTCARCLLVETWARVSAIERHLVEQKGIPETKAPLPPVYGSFTARDPSDVTKTLWTRTGYWIEQRTTEKATAELGICPTCKAGVGYDGKRIHLEGCPAVKTEVEP